WRKALRKSLLLLVGRRRRRGLLGCRRRCRLLRGRRCRGLLRGRRSCRLLGCRRRGGLLGRGRRGGCRLRGGLLAEQAAPICKPQDDDYRDGNPDDGVVAIRRRSHWLAPPFGPESSKGTAQLGDKNGSTM